MLGFCKEILVAAHFLSEPNDNIAFDGYLSNDSCLFPLWTRPHCDSTTKGRCSDRLVPVSTNSNFGTAAPLSGPAMSKALRIIAYIEDDSLIKRILDVPEAPLIQAKMIFVE